VTLSWALAAADAFDPPPPPDHLLSPVNYAVARSRGQFRDARHIRVMEAAILRTIETGGRLIISASVRHAKSWTGSRWLPAWYLGTHPDRRVILAGHEADFARKWGREARDILTEHGPTDFGVRVSPKSEAANRWDLDGHEGGMLTVGVGGSPIGRGGDLIVVDDPIKSYADAMSPLKRERVVEWWTGTMASRVEPGGAVILLMARWHEEDLAGWLLANQAGEWEELRLPALCDDPSTDPLGRELGEALWPERWSVDDLHKRRREVTGKLGEVVWLAQYQGRPQPPAGGMFPEKNWRFLTSAEWEELKPSAVQCRGWDLAATADGGDYTAGALVARLDDDRTVIVDMVRDQWDSADVRARLKEVAAADDWGVDIELPQDPGQAGKAQAEQLVAMLSGHNVHAQLQSGSKEVRATGLAAQQQRGNVYLVEGEWNGPFIAECAGFPRGAHDDQVDAAATAFNHLAGWSEYDLRWVG
jgi:predicted phage terminase large subunit-like protein